jgi:DNA-binding transcriptional MocR family regulator
MIEISELIKFDKASTIPLYIQLFENLKSLITDGTLVHDVKLPSIRQLSKELGVNRITVVTAFKELEINGYVYTKPGSGTFVSNSFIVSAKNIHFQNNFVLDEVYTQEYASLINNGQVSLTESSINFASATPTPDLFPVDDFKVALNEVLERDKGNAFGYQDSQGYYPIRESICQVLGKAMVTCNPDDIQIISGAQQGIDIISKAFLRQGDYIITESPTYSGAIAVFKSRGAQIADIELCEDGMNLNILEYTIKKYKPRLLYTIPSFQNPTGYSCSNHKREQLLKLADKYDLYIIEDDYVSDLDFENRKYLPLKSMDKNNRVIFIKSYSKIFMPGLRLGFMIVPTGILSNVIEAKHATDISTSGLIQRAFDLYIRKGFWDKHSQFMYDIYKERYIKTINALDKYLPSNVNYKKPGGGLNIWLNLPPGFQVNKLVALCAAKDIVFAPGKIFYSSNSSQKLNNIRLSFASVYVENTDHGIKTLSQIITIMEQKNESYRNLPIL